MFQKTTAIQKITQLTKRIKVIQGGTSAGKTVGIIIYLITKAQRGKVSISIVSESLPHLKRAAIRDFISIMQEQGDFVEERWNRTDKIYTFETGSTIEFFAIDEAGKVRGPRRDVLFINECNNIPYEIYDQLEIRTREEIILDYNPVSEFWVHTEVIPNIDHDFLKLTYKDNEALDPRIVETIESRKGRENWWRVYGLGEVGVLEGTIYKDWELIDGVPAEARLEGYGLDFGYTLDPTAIIAVYYLDNSFILDEVTYLNGLSNGDIANIFKGQTKAVVVADSAEPKSIDEIKRYGIQVIPARKGADSINHGIQLIQDQSIKITKRSTNLLKEYRNYTWKKDKDGNSVNPPEDIWNHGLDAVRYFLSHKLLGKSYQGLLQYMKENKPDGNTRYSTQELVRRAAIEGDKIGIG